MLARASSARPLVEIPTTCGILLVPLISLVIRFLSKLFRRHSARIQDSMGDVSRITAEALQSHRIVKIFEIEMRWDGVTSSALEIEIPKN